MWINNIVRKCEATRNINIRSTIILRSLWPWRVAGLSYEIRFILYKPVSVSTLCTEGDIILSPYSFKNDYHNKPHIASLYAPKSWALTSEMKVWLWLSGDNHKRSPFWLASSVSHYLTVLQRFKSETASVYFLCWSGREFYVSFSTSRGLPLAQPCWGYYVIGDDFQLS